VKGDPKVIDHLNTQLTDELTAINQYFLHARTLQHWGVIRLGAFEYKGSIDEMRHADWLIQRILFLEGLPNVQRLNNVAVGQTVEESLRADLALEQKAIGDLREGVAHCETVRDYVSRDLLRRILESEEEHVDFLDRQFDLIRQIGIERYIQLNAAPAPEQGPGKGRPSTGRAARPGARARHGGAARGSEPPEHRGRGEAEAGHGEKHRETRPGRPRPALGDERVDRERAQQRDERRQDPDMHDAPNQHAEPGEECRLAQQRPDPVRHGVRRPHLGHGRARVDEGGPREQHHREEERLHARRIVRFRLRFPFNL
jgi:bacterioferritin